jgi:hypothetical protein
LKSRFFSIILLADGRIWSWIRILEAQIRNTACHPLIFKPMEGRVTFNAIKKLKYKNHEKKHATSHRSSRVPSTAPYKEAREESTKTSYMNAR